MNGHMALFTGIATPSIDDGVRHVLTPARSRATTVKSGAVTQVLIARAREAVSEACADPSADVADLAVSVRVEDADLFVITPARARVHSIGPEATVLCTLHAEIAEPALDGGSRPSSAAASHAHLYRTSGPRAIASASGETAEAPDPLSAVRALSSP